MHAPNWLPYRWIEIAFGSNGNAENLNCRSGGIFALVHFARATLAHRGDFGDPRVALSRVGVGHEPYAIEAGDGGLRSEFW